MSTNAPQRGRGASENPPNRFIPLYRERYDDWDDPEDPAPATRFFRDQTRSILTTNDSPDIPFTFSLNPYRGCEHGCIYCYARPTHEWLSLSAGLDFETQIFVKENAPELLRQELRSRKWVPQTVSISGVTDAYQPIERRLELTRRCLQVFAEFRNPIGIVTKNALVARDIDILKELAAVQGAMVYLSITTLDPDLARVMEPRASNPVARLRAIEELAAAGIPVGVMNAPIIPGLNDHETPAVLEACAKAGAISAGYVVLRLPFAVKELFATWLEQHYPARKERILGRIRETRGGNLNDGRFGSRMKGEGEWAEVFRDMFLLHRRRLGMAERGPKLSTESFTNGRLAQGSLFD
ncbi:MAG: PA0069 family radical SAM protein [Planctomycetes bacterium]|nr:PA0069 family radical SAM protein [Planctomycetota bacterium]